MSNLEFERRLMLVAGDMFAGVSPDRASDPHNVLNASNLAGSDTVDFQRSLGEVTHFLPRLMLRCCRSSWLWR